MPLYPINDPHWDSRPILLSLVYSVWKLDVPAARRMGMGQYLMDLVCYPSARLRLPNWQVCFPQRLPIVIGIWRKDIVSTNNLNDPQFIAQKTHVLAILQIGWRKIGLVRISACACRVHFCPVGGLHPGNLTTMAL